MIGRGSDVTDSVPFEEIFKPFADEVAVTTISGKLNVAKVILNF